MNKVSLFILILSTILSCDKSVEHQDLIYSDFLIIKNGSRLIQGEKYEIIWNTKGLISNKFYSDIIFHFEKQGSFQHRVVKLDKKDSIHYSGVIEIPPNTSWIYISLSTPYNSLSCPYSVRLPVFINETKPEFGANSVALVNSNKDNYLKYFYDERRLYPENYSIYVVRWRYELDNNIFVKDTLMKHLKEFETLGNIPDIQILKLIGNSIIMNYSMHSDILKELSQTLEFSTCLNNWETSGILSNMLINNFDRDTLHIKLLIDNILRYNPYSDFVNSMINRGVLADNRIISPKSALEVFNKLLQRDSSLYILLKKAMLLSLYFNQDSLNQLDLIVSKIQNSYYDYFNDEETYYKIQDFFHSFYHSKGLFPEIVKRLAYATSRYQYYIEHLKNLVFKSVDFSTKGIFFYSIAELYEKVPLIDSAIKFYYYSYYFLPSWNSPEQKLQKLFNIKSNQRDFGKVINFLNKKYSFPLTRLGRDIPLLEYDNGNKEDITLTNVPKIIIFFNTRCSPCEKVFKDMAGMITDLQKKNINLYFISSEELDNLNSLWIYDYFESNVIKNPIQIKNYFGIGEDIPQIILVNSDNYIVNWISGYSDDGINFKQIIKNLN